MECAIRDDLQQNAIDALQRIVNITDKQIDALKARDQIALLSIDKELELAFGAKERAFGALHQHTREHGCS